MDSGRMAEAGGERPHLIVLVSSDRLEGGIRGGGETVDGRALSQSDLESLACDASLSRMIMDRLPNPSTWGERPG